MRRGCYGAQQRLSTAPKRGYSEIMHNTASLPPFSPPLVTIIGGAGFIGTALVEAFARSGWRVLVTSRTVQRARHLRPLGDVGQIDVILADVMVPESLRRAVAAADVVVNLAGILQEGPQRFADVHVTGAGHVAQAAAAAGARGLVHLSAIGADSASPSAYGRTKAAGEAAVAAAFPAAAIIRPSLVFGADDQFTNRFAGMMVGAPVMPVVAGDTRWQPVYVADVADAIVTLAGRMRAEATGGVFELGGPEVLTMRALLEQIAAYSERPVRFVDVPAAGARLLSRLPGTPLTRDQLQMLQHDNVVSGRFPGLAELAVPATPLAAVAPNWLGRYRPGGRFAA